MRRSGLVGLGLVLVVSAAGVGFAWRWFERGPGRPSVSAAIGRFRTSTTVGTATNTSTPRPGVYLYKGAGSGSLSFLATRQEQGPIEPGTVVVRPNGCWEFRIDFNSFHDQTWERCRTNSKLVESGGRTDQRFDFVTFKMSEHSTVTCDPPIVAADANDKPGTTSRVHCTGRSQTTKTTFAQTGVSTFVGREAVLVGGVSIPGLHTREDMLLSGGQTGVVRVDIWFAASDGLPLKEVTASRSFHRHRLRSITSPTPRSGVGN